MRPIGHLKREFIYKSDKELVQALLDDNNPEHESAIHYLTVNKEFKCKYTHNYQKSGLSKDPSYELEDGIAELILYLLDNNKEKLKKYDLTIGPFKAWISVVSYRLFRDIANKNRIETRGNDNGSNDDDIDKTDDEPTEPGINPPMPSDGNKSWPTRPEEIPDPLSAPIPEEELKEALLQLLPYLHNPMQEELIRRYWDGETLKEVAESLGIKNPYVIYSRGVAKLLQMYNDENNRINNTRFN